MEDRAASDARCRSQNVKKSNWDGLWCHSVEFYPERTPPFYIITHDAEPINDCAMAPTVASMKFTVMALPYSFQKFFFLSLEGRTMPVVAHCETRSVQLMPCFSRTPSRSAR